MAPADHGIHAQHRPETEVARQHRQQRRRAPEQAADLHDVALGGPARGLDQRQQLGLVALPRDAHGGAQKAGGHRGVRPLARRRGALQPLDRRRLQHPPQQRAVLLGQIVVVAAEGERDPGRQVGQTVLQREPDRVVAGVDAVHAVLGDGGGQRRLETRLGDMRQGQPRVVPGGGRIVRDRGGADGANAEHPRQPGDLRPVAVSGRKDQQRGKLIRHAADCAKPVVKTR